MEPSGLWAGGRTYLGDFTTSASTTGVLRSTWRGWGRTGRRGETGRTNGDWQALGGGAHGWEDVRGGLGRIRRAAEAVGEADGVQGENMRRAGDLTLIKRFLAGRMMEETRGWVHVWPSGTCHREEFVGDLQRGTSNTTQRHEGGNEAAMRGCPHTNARFAPSPSSPAVRSSIRPPYSPYRLARAHSPSEPRPLRQRSSLHSIRPYIIVPDKSPRARPPASHAHQPHLHSIFVV
ncbi:hypothetical protein C8Q78DRAFT_827147 [Trametes maxima]|nr:hypothetical protein C8Q78DRAFT_827147 [Trametes maxima]